MANQYDRTIMISSNVQPQKHSPHMANQYGRTVIIISFSVQPQTQNVS